MSCEKCKWQPIEDLPFDKFVLVQTEKGLWKLVTKIKIDIEGEECIAWEDDNGWIINGKFEPILWKDVD